MTAPVVGDGEQHLLADLELALTNVRRGWTQGRYYNPVRGTCCVVGAIRLATLGIEVEPYLARLDEPTFASPTGVRERQAVRHIERYLEAHDLIGDDEYRLNSADDLVAWNDHAERTKSEVEQVLTEVIELLRD